MTQTAGDLESTFQRAWALLIKNPIIVVPGIVVALVGGAVGVMAVILLATSVLVTGASGSTTVGVLSIGFTVLLAIALIMVLAIVQTAFITGMAGSAWERGTTTLAEGWAALRARGGQIFYAIVLLFLIGCGALLLAPLTLLLSIFFYIVFFLYVTSSVIIGGNDATHAIGDSCRLAARNFWPTAGVAALICAVSFLASIAGAEIGRIEPFAGGLTAAVLQQAAVAYGTLVIVGEYVKLHAAPAQPAA